MSFGLEVTPFRSSSPHNLARFRAYASSSIGSVSLVSAASAGSAAAVVVGFLPKKSTIVLPLWGVGLGFGLRFLEGEGIE